MVIELAHRGNIVSCLSTAAHDLDFIAKLAQKSLKHFILTLLSSIDNYGCD